MKQNIYRDTYRIYGNDTRFQLLIGLRDYRLLYLYCWRAVKKHSFFSLACKLILRHLRKHYHIEIPYTVSLEGGFFMEHAYNITINSKAVLGKNVTMYKGSTIGMDRSGVPVIGNNVYIGLNATIVGGIKVGDNVLIAPNTFINFDVPSDSVVLGNPGTIHYKSNSTEGYLLNCVS